MGLGGPVWHASVAAHGLVVPPEQLFVKAADALAGVGDPALGEWREVGDVAVHLRRRLSAIEQRRVGPVIDVRGTPEYDLRMIAAKRHGRVPADWQE